MRAQPSAVDDWEFYTDPAGRWSWRHVGYEGRCNSHAVFRGIVEAIADAVRHGYEPGVSHIEMEQCRRAQPRGRESTRDYSI